jgi:hypothetical protein
LRCEGGNYQNARDDQHDALGALQDGGRPVLLPVLQRDSLVAGPLVELSNTLGGPSDDEPDFSYDDFLARLSKIGSGGLGDGLDVLTEHENELVQLVLAP